MADNVMESKDAVSAVAEDAKKRAREEAIVGYTLSKFGRVVLVTRKKYSHMRKCGDLLIDLDGNQSRFSKLNDKQLEAYKTGNMKQNQVVCEGAPDDMSELEVEVKAILKQDHKDSQVERKAFDKVLADREAKKAGNINVVVPAPAVDDGKIAELDAKTKEVDEKADANATKEKALDDREKALEDAEKELKAKADTPTKVIPNAPQGQGANK